MFGFLQKYIAQPTPTAAAAPTRAEAPASARWLSTASEFIAEDEMGIERLLTLFRQAFIDVETAPGGERLVLRGESGLRMLLSVDPQRQLLQLTVGFGLVEAAPMHEKLAAANRLNAQVVYLRASILDETTLTLDHQLNYEGGISKAAVVGLVRRTDRIAPLALKQVFGDSLLT